MNGITTATPIEQIRVALSVASQTDDATLRGLHVGYARTLLTRLRRDVEDAETLVSAQEREIARVASAQIEIGGTR